MTPKKRDFEFPKICLEKWAQWHTEHHGFPDKSPILKLGDTGACSSTAKSQIPIGVESNDRDIERTSLILAMMGATNATSAKRAFLLKSVGLNRQGSESVHSVMQRLNLKESERIYYDALEEFAIRLDTVLYSKK